MAELRLFSLEASGFITKICEVRPNLCHHHVQQTFYSVGMVNLSSPLLQVIFLILLSSLQNWVELSVGEKCCLFAYIHRQSAAV